MATDSFSSEKNAAPWGVRFLRFIRLPSPFSRVATYQISILLLTYIFYVNYHSARRPLGVVKNVLRQNCTNITPPEPLTEKEFRNGTWCQWSPFDQNSQQLFSILDFVFRFSYAVGMLFAGYIAERTNLRTFIASGMTLAGLFCILNGMAFFWNIHSFSYFVLVNFFAGTFQGTGWPSVVSLVGNWFGRRRRGLIFGIWNSHTSVGNIVGAVVAAVWVNELWGMSFIVPGLMIISCGLIAFLFVVPHPNDVDLPSVSYSEIDFHNTVEPVILTASESSGTLVSESQAFVDQRTPDALREADMKPISIWNACKIPAVIEFSLSLFFSKAVYYTFFFWLPVYIKMNTSVGNHVAADLSAVFDAGGIVGGILAGAISDAIGGSATICGCMFLLAIPSLYCMVLYVYRGVDVLITLLIITGLFVNGPYALITTAVSADLGTRPSLTNNQRSLATVAGVIDGMGSLGSAVGPLGAGLLVEYGWNAVFYYLITAQVVALLFLTRLIYRELLHWWELWSQKKQLHHSLSGLALKTSSEINLSPVINQPADLMSLRQAFRPHKQEEIFY